MIKLKVMAYIHILMEPNMKDIGRMINRKGKGEKYGLMGIHMKGNMLVGINKEKVNLHGVMVLFMKVIS